MTMTSPRQPSFATLALHAGTEPEGVDARSPNHRFTPSSRPDIEHAAAFGPEAYDRTDPACALLEQRVTAHEGDTMDESTHAFPSFGWQVRWADPSIDPHSRTVLSRRPASSGSGPGWKMWPT